MLEIIDHGHKYRLLTLDAHGQPAEQDLIFVKREDPSDKLKFPGNQGRHSGTTIQSVLRVLHSRTAFLDSQHHCAENIEIMQCLRRANYLLEQRAARRHERQLTLNEDECIDAPMCPTCGHVECGGHSK